jgi:BTB/POZ domain
MEEMMMAATATTCTTAADSATEMMMPSAPPSPPRTTDDSLTTTTYHYNKQLLQTGAFADCTILCRPQDPSYSARSTTSTSTSRPAHRNILAPRCEFFRCCFEGAFREARTPCVVDMRGDDPVAVEGLLYYLYTLEYPAEVYERVLFAGSGAGAGLGSSCSDSGIEDEDEDEASKGEAPGLDPRVYWGFDLLMHDVADKYGLLGLREMAARSLLAKAEWVGKGTEAREEGEKQQQQRRQFLKTLNGFVALMEDLYPAEEESQEAEQEEGNDLRRTLRRQVVRLTCQGIARHIRDERISTLMADVPGFAVELVEMLAKRADQKRLVQREEDKKEEALKARLSHVPMNEESDCED